MPPTTSRRILPLSAQAIAQIHSSKHITSLQGAVCALLENCLDAEASRVDVSVDWRKGCCTVNDNGRGIPSVEFDEDGGLGKLYCTSKRSTAGFHTSETHGSSGTFLAELAAISLLNVTSTQQGQSAAAELTMYQGKVIARRLPDRATSVVNLGQENGTNVTVRDLFGNMPVRIKHRALAGEASGEDDKCWLELKHSVVALLLAWPKPCAVRLRDVNAEAKVVTISGHHLGAPNTLTMKSLVQLAGKRVRSDLRDALPILFQAGLVSPDSRNQWVPLSVSTSAISLKGLICLVPAPTKQCQFIALGITPCSPASGHNEMYDAAAKVFANSSFGVVEESTFDRGTSRQLRGKKGVDRYPMFYIQLTLKDQSRASATDFDRLSDSSLKAVVNILEAGLTAWLTSNHFRPRKSRQQRNQEHVSPAGPLPSLLAKRPNVPNNNKRAFESIPHNGEQKHVIDVSGRPIPHDMRFWSSLTADAGEVSTLSKIRIGMSKDRPQSATNCAPEQREDLEAQQARIATSSVSRESHLQMKVNKRLTLPAAGIEAGVFGGKHRGQACLSSLHKSPVPQRRSQAVDSSAKACLGGQDIPSSEDFGSIDDVDLLSAERADPQPRHTHHDGYGNWNDDSVTWTDPVSKQVFSVISRTGVVLPREESRHSNGDTSTRQRAAIDTRLSSKGKPLSLARRTAITEAGTSRPSTADSTEWLPGFLEQWSNPVFARQKEEPIAVASRNEPGPLELDGNVRGCSHGRSNFESDSAGIKLTKAALREAEVIAQVDTKFILCKMPAARGKLQGESTLVLIDQHAASERVMLENLLEELCAPSNDDTTSIHTTSLHNGTTRARSLILEVSSRELDLFARYRPHFARWGVLYDTLSPRNQQGVESRIRITHLPTPVAERCANVPSLAIEMLRSEIWALEDGGRRTTTTVAASEVGTRHGCLPLWLSLLSAIPPSLLALIHSRSCRSAIMFNDVLSQEQCVKLVEQLGKCVFPFACAHGRVSMVPLGDLRLADVEPSEAEEVSESRAMSAWLTSLDQTSGGYATP